MKLALVISSLGCGGAERVMTLLANGWAGRGNTVVLITLSDPKTDFYGLHPVVRRIGLNLLKESRNPLAALVNNWRRDQGLREAIRESDPDAVISFMTSTNILTALSCRGLNTPVLLSEHISPANERLRGAWRLLRRLTYARAQLVVLTERNAQWFRQRFPRSHVRVIPNPVVVAEDDVGNEVSYRLVKSLPTNPFIVAMGRLVPQKGFDLLVRAFASIHWRHPEWSLVILGDGPEREKIWRLALTLGIGDCVHMPGRVARPHAVLRRAKLFALSSRFEGMPMALLEAMACGLPCVSFDCPTGPAELIVHNVNGLLIPPEDLPALAQSLVQLMNDPALRVELGRQAACAVQNAFTLESVLTLWEDLLTSIVQPRKNETAGARRTDRIAVEWHTYPLRSIGQKALKDRD
ncbi:MAG: glycosyltransferase family 4 protein [Nitrococcus sp.]|nr:glycosyltransferase family 4 protein [Nitrococcus sp.]